MKSVNDASWFSQLAGAVFDLDGTLLDNMPFHIEAFNAFAARHGLPALTLERRKWMDGKRNRDIFPGLFERELSADELEAMAEEKESLYRSLSVGRLRPLTGLLRLLDLLDARGVPVAIATSAPLRQRRPHAARARVHFALPGHRPQRHRSARQAVPGRLPRGGAAPRRRAHRLPRLRGRPGGDRRRPRGRDALRRHRDELSAARCSPIRSRRRTAWSATTTSSSPAQALRWSEHPAGTRVGANR